MITRLTRCAFQIVIVFLVILEGCKSHTVSHQAAPMTPVNIEPAVRIPLDTMDPAYDGLSRKKLLTIFYRGVEARPVWSKESIPTAQADTLISFLQHTAYYGLPNAGYHVNELIGLVPDRSASARQRFDLLLTDAYLILSHDLRYGPLASHAESSSDSVNLETLKTIIQQGGIVPSLQSQEPDYPGYRALKTCLKAILDSASEHDTLTILSEELIQKIGINLERWRHESLSWEPRHLVVNIPAYRLDIVDNGDTVLSSRVIVGNPEHPTPELSSIIRSLTLYPYWVVPRKIAIDEYLPVIQKDTAFFTRSDFEVVDRKGNLLDPGQLPWKTFHKNNFPVVLRQREGTGNALGLIKFSFENPYAVFLHDTNAKHLFKNETRAFSHGCIRVEKAAAIARYLMTGSPSKESVLVKKYLDEQRQAVISVPRPLPIYVRYFTAEVTYGALAVYPDIYGNDELLSGQLYGLGLEGEM